MSRCSCSPITWRPSWAGTSTSRATWPRASRSNSARSVEGLRLLHASAPRQRLLAPDDLAGRRPAGAPALGELAHDLQAASVLVVSVRRAQPRQRAGGVDDLADQSPLVDSEERRVGKECRYRWSPY